MSRDYDEAHDPAKFNVMGGVRSRVQDGCTESNCRRCLTHPNHRDDMTHAGIGTTGKQQGDVRSLISKWRSESVGREDETGYIRGVMFTFAKCADELASCLPAVHSVNDGKLGFGSLDHLANEILEQHCPAGSYDRSDVLDAITAALAVHQPVNLIEKLHDKSVFSKEALLNKVRDRQPAGE